MHGCIIPSSFAETVISGVLFILFSLKSLITSVFVGFPVWSFLWMLNPIVWSQKWLNFTILNILESGVVIEPYLGQAYIVWEHRTTSHKILSNEITYKVEGEIIGR